MNYYPRYDWSKGHPQRPAEPSVRLRHILIALLAVLALSTNVGCAQPAADSAPWDEDGESARAPVAVSYILSPEERLLKHALVAAERWNAARGCYPGSTCELVMGEGGIPVQYVPQIVMTKKDGTPIMNEDGTPKTARGVAQVKGPTRPGADWNYVHVSEDVNDPERILMHEFGHLLGITEHTETGVVLSVGRNITREEAIALEYWTVNDEVLTEVCSKTQCLEFIPEPPVLQ